MIELIYKPSSGQSVPQRQTRRPPPVRSRSRNPGERFGEEENIQGVEPVNRDELEKKEKEEKQKKSKLADSKLLKGVHGLARKITPINLSYTENINKTGMGVLGSVPFGYRLGTQRDHGLDHSTQVGTNTGNFDHRRDFSIRSGLNLTRSMSISFNFGQNISSNLRGSGTEQRSMSRDYLSYGSHLDKGFPFVGWSLRLTGLERNKFIGKFFRTMSLDHATNGKETRAWQFDKFAGSKISFLDIDDFISNYKDNERTSRVNMNFAPLIGATIALKQGVSINMRHNRTISRETTVNGGAKVFNDQSYLLSANYLSLIHI